MTFEQKSVVKKRSKVWKKLNRDKNNIIRRRYYAKYRSREKLRSVNWTKANPLKAKERDLLYRYNITLEEKEKILVEQNGVCAVCKRPQSDFKKALSVDHDHSTHLIRGLLCWHCNAMLPTRKNLEQLFINLLEYIKNPPAIKVLGERKANPVRRRSFGRKKNVT